MFRFVGSLSTSQRQVHVQRGLTLNLCYSLGNDLGQPPRGDPVVMLVDDLV